MWSLVLCPQWLLSGGRLAAEVWRDSLGVEHITGFGCLVCEHHRSILDSRFCEDIYSFLDLRFTRHLMGLWMHLDVCNEHCGWHAPVFWIPMHRTP